MRIHQHSVLNSRILCTGRECWNICCGIVSRYTSKARIGSGFAARGASESAARERRLLAKVGGAKSIEGELCCKPLLSCAGRWFLIECEFLMAGKWGEHNIWASHSGVRRNMLLSVFTGLQRGHERPVALAKTGRAAPGGVHGLLLLQPECIRRRRRREHLLHVPPHLGPQKNIAQSVGARLGGPTLGSSRRFPLRPGQRLAVHGRPSRGLRCCRRCPGTRSTSRHSL